MAATIGHVSKGAIVLTVIFVLAGVFAGLNSMGAPGGDDTAPSGTPIPEQTGNRWSVTVAAEDYGFTSTLDTLPPGTAAFEVVATGDVPHELQILRLNDGVAFARFAKVARRVGRGPELFELATPVGGAGAGGGLPPEASQRLVLDLEIGTYGFVSFLNGDNEKGMIRRFDVAEGVVTPAGVPETSGDITLDKNEFRLPDAQLASGVFRVVNATSEIHEAAVFKLEGAPETYVDRFDTESAEGAAGFGLLGPGAVNYSQLNLAPGGYAFVCRVVDPDTGKPYYEQGMFSTFEVIED